MRKFILMLVALFVTVSVANAQLATENSKLFDNVYVGAEIGVTTPLSFDDVFPVNTVTGIRVGKELTPIFGLEIEGMLFYNNRDFKRFSETFVKGTNLGLNGTVNFNNLFAGYKGTPRFFEVKLNTGLSWVHFCKGPNDLVAKVGADFNFNLGKKKAHTVFVGPNFYWDLQNGAKLQFNKNLAQFGLMAGYIYHFKTSNGTHHFKTYDVGAMTRELNALYKENLEQKALLEKKGEQAVKYVDKVVDKIQYVKSECVVNFALNSYELTEEAKEVLDSVEGSVDVLGYASPEGTEEYNLNLSQKRADVVAEYLKAKGVDVKKAVGYGSVNNESNRIVIVKVVE